MGRTYHHGNLRQVLIEEGGKLLEEKGLDALTLRGLGLRAGVSRTAAYRHFPDKSALLAAISEAAFSEFARCLEEARDRAPAGNCLAQLVEMGKSYLQFSREFPAYYNAMFGLRCDPGNHRPASGESGDRAFRVLRDVIVDGQGSGELRPGDPDLIALAVWTMAHGIVSLGLSIGLHGGEQQQVSEGIHNLLLKGIQRNAG